MSELSPEVIAAIRAEAVAEYKKKLIANLRDSGAPVRRLLADEIEAGKHDK
jgi:hypothetical protein